jgi:hypothetical protein
MARSIADLIGSVVQPAAQRTAHHYEQQDVVATPKQHPIWLKLVAGDAGST